MLCSRIWCRTLFVVFSGVSVAIVGCAQQAPTEVSGTIKVNGKIPKMKGLYITFMNTGSGRMASAAIGSDGTYKADDVSVGETKVGFALLSAQPTGDAQPGAGNPRLKKPGKDGAAPSPPAQVYNPIPKELRDPSTSSITTNFESGKANVFDYDIKP
jgi:hypothetical protein